MKKQIAILGSTGSIGTQALEVIRYFPELFEAYALTANNQYELLARQAREFMPEVVVIANELYYHPLQALLADLPIKVYAGSRAVEEIVVASPIDVVLTAMVGFAGLAPTIAAIGAGKAIALANKETLVVAGDLITQLAIRHNVPILPVDSEHSAIFQCLNGEPNKIEKIILTASGGPFRGYTQEQLQQVTRAQALCHPNWTMGAKITIDSASLMNKGFEVIEGKWLFDLQPSQIEVVVHPQSIVHSMVQFADGALMAQLGVPDMKLPISYAFSYPYRLDTPEAGRLDFSRLHQWSFSPPDTAVFRCLALAYDCLAEGGNACCILNAANEVAVDAFLSDRIRFIQIPQLIERTLEHSERAVCTTTEEYTACDALVRIRAREILRTINTY